MGDVELKPGVRASELLYEVLEQARGAHPGAFEGLRWPASAKAFRKQYASSLIAFEKRRVASPERAAIAKTIVETSRDSMVYSEGESHTPLASYLETEAEPLPTQTVKLEQTAGLVPEVTFQGRYYQGAELAELTDEWFDKRWMTASAHEGIRWTLDQAMQGAKGRTDLVGHKIVSLGGGAELSPTRAMLRAGADVLYLDVREPRPELLSDPLVSGTITYVPGGANLLSQPREIAATIRAFAGEDPVHIGMYAYSGGAAQEWRLTAAMNAIVRSLPPALVRSLVMLISPTTPGTVSTADEATSNERKRWFLGPLGLGRSPSATGQSGEWPNRVSHSIVGLQGVAYQAAQYIGKMMAAEVYAIYGSDERGDGRLTISAPVAPITKTASLQHPLFDAGFEGAELFDILVSEPQPTRVMCALLAFHDLLRPDAPSRREGLEPAERLAAIMGEQIHGGVFAQPYALEREIVAAAVAGLARKPSLLPPAARFLMGGR